MKNEKIIYTVEHLKNIDNDVYKISWSKSKKKHHCRVPRIQIVYEEGDKKFQEAKGKTTKAYKYKDIYGETKEEVRQKARQYIQDEIYKQNTGEVEKEKITFFIDDMEDWLYKDFRKVEDKTFTRKETTFKCQIKPYAPAKQTKNITVADLNAIMKRNANKGYSQSSLKKLRLLLKEFFDDQYANDMISRNPANKYLEEYKDREVDLIRKRLREERENIWKKVLSSSKVTYNEIQLLTAAVDLSVDVDYIDNTEKKTSSPYIITKEWINALKEKIKNSEAIDEETKYFGLRLKKQFTTDEVELLFTHLKLEDKKNVEPLTVEELEKIKYVIKNGYMMKGVTPKGRLYTHGPCFILQAEFFLVMLYQALRVGEAAALKYSDIDFEKNTITISGSVKRVNERDSKGKKTGKTKLEEGKTKTESSFATIPLHSQAKEILLEMKSKENEGYNGYVVNDKGNMISENALAKRFRNLMKYAGVENKATHVLRHTGLTLVYDQTKDIQVTKTIARHSAASITQDIYVDESRERITEQYNKVNY